MATQTRSAFVETLLGQASLPAPQYPHIDRVRAAALERANALSVPTTRDEDWRFTDLSTLARASFQPPAGAGQLAPQALRALTFPEASARLVFVDGVYAPEHSHIYAQSGVRVIDLRTSFASCRELIEPYLAKLAPYHMQLFSAMNTAFMRDGALIVLDADCVLPGPVHLLNVATRHERAHAIYPRHLVIAHARSAGTIVEEFVAVGDAAYFTAPVTEIALHHDAALTHVRLQRDAPGAYHIGTCAVTQARASSYRSIGVAFGARLSRVDLSVVHTEPACETVIDGLALIGQRQLADTHSFVDHAKPAGRLRQSHKCIVAGGAHGVFNGKVLVRQGALSTDAAQSFRALLLSDRAQVDVKPQLEIFADDVKCAHGAAIGQLDPDELFYLRSRGLDEGRARNLLTYAFAAEIITRIPVPTLAAALASTLLDRTQEAA